ncbi:prolyl-tRNA synthetase [Xylona heveae TC161]|uniref:proline--tRNA ligase n=1 Tax=Xylona heveae (strain CBS 132557 / TC161) TaxID=1328760 RepID=A0A165JJF0_XYLHT|nr:prolyl-tRNA synthetase [Xylona heveae TC161]KZF26312.1 prolyl-tRNA synthetase [Xylona heveae TC161]
MYSLARKRSACHFLTFRARHVRAICSRFIHQNGPENRLSSFWIPTGGITSSRAVNAVEDSHALLLRAGFLRQAYSGVFHLLPLGLRVQEKLEKLIDKHMQNLSASKLSLSTISSEELWRTSGRLQGERNPELFHFQDRKGSRYLLSPTHEEEITALVASISKSYKDLPIRLYQITRKYRDEPRPRQGLLRTREFLMKDLYTFDYSTEKALQTYNDVRGTYEKIFGELKLPFLVAEADSGNMGGSLSHEYHFPTSKGEDYVISCSGCGFVSNEELAEGKVEQGTLNSPALRDKNGSEPATALAPPGVWFGITKDRRSLIRVYYPSQYGNDTRVTSSVNEEVNTHAVKRVVPTLDAGIEQPLQLWKEEMQRTEDHRLPGAPNIVNVFDYRVHSYASFAHSDNGLCFLHSMVGSRNVKSVSQTDILLHPETNRPMNLTRTLEGDPCPNCAHGSLRVQKAVELGHTFFLGSRYSKSFKAEVAIPKSLLPEPDCKDAISNDSPSNRAREAVTPELGTTQTVLQMGCHGIGVSRMIAAVADSLADERGLNWPRVMAPFEVVIIAKNGLEDDASQVYNLLSYGKNTIPSQRSSCRQLDVVIDDRNKSLPWKLSDADLIGYPVIVVLSKSWKAAQKCEVQCRRLNGLKTEVPLDELGEYVESLLQKL